MKDPMQTAPVGSGDRRDTSSLTDSPHDTTTHIEAAEAAVLGAMLLSTEARIGAIDMLATDDFERGAHRTLFDVLAAMHAANIHIDNITVNDELGRLGKLEEIGSLASVWELTSIEGCPVPAAWATYGVIVAREARRRCGIRVLQRALERLMAGEDPAIVAAEMAVAA
jgi:replicative DNA helicase